MYRKIFIAIDNSRFSDYCIDFGVMLSRKYGSRLVGCHVYDAKLHQRRFRDMEKGLPPQYQNETELQRQRDLHTTLINQGLKLISESYLDVFKKKCRESEVAHDALLLEGKNYSEIVKEVDSGGYDLVIIGAQGLAAVNDHVIGSVCERVVRRIKTDVLVVKNNCLEGSVVVAVDGSHLSSEGVRLGVEFSKAFYRKLSAVSVFDPHYHRVAFESIAGVLSKEAGQVFRFKEQETLHEEIIDKGLAKIYRNHLDYAESVAKAGGVALETRLFDGKPYDKILQAFKSEKPSLLILGRTGVHSTEGLDIGSTTENLLRLSTCNLLLVGGNKESKKTASRFNAGMFGLSIEGSNVANPFAEQALAEAGYVKSGAGGREILDKPGQAKVNKPVWTHEAQIQTERIPSFIREVVRAKIEEYAQKNGFTEITVQVVTDARSKIMGDNAVHKI